MAKYAISKEGAEALNQLANDLLINANNVVEMNCQLEQVTISIYEDLGIYGDEIIGIIQRNRQTLNNNREDIINLAQQVKKQAQNVESLIVIDVKEDVSGSAEKSTGLRGLFDGLFGRNSNLVNEESLVAFGTGLWVTQDKMNAERYFVNGNHPNDL